MDPFLGPAMSRTPRPTINAEQGLAYLGCKLGTPDDLLSYACDAGAAKEPETETEGEREEFPARDATSFPQAETAVETDANGSPLSTADLWA